MKKEELKKLISERIELQHGYMLNNKDFVDGYSHLPSESGFADATTSTQIDLTPKTYGFTDEFELYEWLYENGKITMKVLPFSYGGYYFGGISFLYESLHEYELQIDELNDADERTRSWLAEELQVYVSVHGDTIVSNNCPINILIYIDDNNLRRALIERYLEHNLPIGSGINGSWKIDIDNKGTVKAKNSIDYMSENGFYDGYNDFTVILPLADGKYKKENMRLVVHNWNYKTIKYWKNYDYQDYVETVIYDSLPIEL